MFICDISVFNRYGKRQLDDRLKSLDMDWQALVAILVIDQVPGITQQRLKPFLQTDKANVSKLLTKLADRNLLVREKSATDLRHNGCVLTEQGKALVPELQHHLDAWETSLYQNISREDLETFKRVNAMITQNLVPDWEKDTD